MAINLEIAAGFRDAFQEGIRSYDGDPKRQLIELCKQYISFMVKNPDYFRYIFMTVHERKIGNDPEWVGEFLILWSQIHGLTLLMVNRTIEYKGDYLAFAHNMIESHLNSVEDQKF